MEIFVKDYLGTKVNAEDAIILRDMLNNCTDENIILNFEGIENVPATFFNCLFGEDLYLKERKEIFAHVDVKNLSNIRDYSRVVLGTAFIS